MSGFANSGINSGANDSANNMASEYSALDSSVLARLSDLSAPLLDKRAIFEILQERTKGWEYKTLSSLPHPYALKSCEQASKLIAKHINEGSEILVVGDYDVDGVISSVVMMKFFEMIGYKRVKYIIPNRFTDGYGLSVNIIKQNPSDVIITVDNGITAYEAGEYCAENGIDLIITDHHLPKEILPRASFIINPQQSDCSFPQAEICGAMVAWYFCAGVRIALGADVRLTPLLELVMLATIADMMPLTQINKCVVLYGLKSIQDTKFLPVKKLKKGLRSPKPTATDVSFSITPLLNAAGRMGEGRVASEFLLCDDEARSERLYEELVSLNVARKSTAKSVQEEAMQNARIYQNAIIAKNDDWHEGVLGIAAAQLADHFRRPAFIFSRTKNHGLKGSARSFGEVDLIGVLNRAKDILGEFGGHFKAAGVAIDEARFDEFCAFLEELDDLPMREEGGADSAVFGAINPKDIDEELFLLLEQFEPYGQANPKPVFESILRIGWTQKIKQIHKKFGFMDTAVEGIYFFCDDDFGSGDIVRVKFGLQVDFFSKKPIMILQSMELA
ncbi:single-stranded-DNA-specific exonuclease RecJ [Helicobacter sp. CLO-3]|uniref:single-stranded-DNA-specific exonuclease RecJ n=1 Tax=unclassified Helicobacter TaxID=2593540 RepID=UPI00080546DC|nr:MULTISPECIES: single-stranded-DNA-specific exonuclease RecJ [unclassified Helicobacter]OBV28325.1 single-stranded-DNA-specific exonuclease RecJ [Helicobacter sp. CLO-3]OHU84537.1 single-stranded-DNA-specific exonuclease RecJ [Helicobacter sp. CLO-3]